MRCFNPIRFILGKIRDHHTKRIDDPHNPRRLLLEFITYRMLKPTDFNTPLRAGNPDVPTERTYGGSGYTTTLQTHHRWQPRIIPPIDKSVLDQITKFALAHYRKVEVESGEFVLVRALLFFPLGQTVLKNPVIQDAIGIEFEGTEGMRHVLYGILKGVGEVVHGINTPLVIKSIMLPVKNAEQQRIPHNHMFR